MRVGIVGAGVMGQVHAAAWAETAAELVGVASVDTEAAQALASRYGVRAFNSYEALLEATDVVDLCVPSDLHCAMTLEAAEAGVHVVCEKPIALSIADAERMIRVCEGAGVRLFIAMVLRFFPQYRAAQRTASAGELGRLGVVRLKRLAYPPQGANNWFADPHRSGGMLVDLLLHDFDYACWLAGPVERVFAKSIRAATENSLEQVGSEAARDYALVTLRHEGGAMTLVEGGWANPPGVFRTGFDIAGSEGLLEWRSEDAETIRPYLMAPPTAAARVGVLRSATSDPYAAEIRHVYEALTNNEPFRVTPEEALGALRVALAAKRSLATGRPVAPSEVAS